MSDDSENMARRILLALAVISASTATAQAPPQPGFFVDMQFLWFDSPIAPIGFQAANSNARDESGLVEFAPRLSVGYDDVIGARVRWWTFDRTTTLETRGVGSRLNFDVIDLEATTQVQRGGSDFLFAGGARVASIETNEHDVVNPSLVTHEDADLAGVTLAAEGRTSIFSNDVWGTNVIYGGRLSLLKANWSGDSYTIFWSPDILNDRYIVPECFAGIEAQYGHAFTRLTVEMQDWRGSAAGAVYHNYGFTGLGFDVGCSF